MDLNDFVKGLDLEKNEISIKELIDSFKTMGFQATNLNIAVNICNEMVILYD